MDIHKLVETGTQLGLEGHELRNFVKEQQDKAREDRLKETKERLSERELAKARIENEKELEKGSVRET